MAVYCAAIHIENVIESYDKSSIMSNKQMKLLDTLLVPVLSGAYAAAISKFFYGEEGSLYYFGMELPAIPGLGAAIFASSLLGNIIGNYALPMIPNNVKFANMEKLIALPFLTGASATGLFYLGAPTAVDNLMRPFKLGFMSEIGAQYSVDIVKPYVNK